MFSPCLGETGENLGRATGEDEKRLRYCGTAAAATAATTTATAVAAIMNNMTGTVDDDCAGEYRQTVRVRVREKIERERERESALKGEKEENGYNVSERRTARRGWVSGGGGGKRSKTKRETGAVCVVRVRWNWWGRPTTGMLLAATASGLLCHRRRGAARTMRVLTRRCAVEGTGVAFTVRTTSWRRKRVRFSLFEFFFSFSPASARAHHFCTLTGDYFQIRNARAPLIGFVFVRSKSGRPDRRRNASSLGFARLSEERQREREK